MRISAEPRCQLQPKHVFIFILLISETKMSKFLAKSTEIHMFAVVSASSLAKVGRRKENSVLYYVSRGLKGFLNVSC